MLQRDKRFRGLGCAALCLLLFLFVRTDVKAEETSGSRTMIGTMQFLSEDTEVREAAEEGSAVVGSLVEGTAVIVEEMSDSYSKVLYQDIEGYIPNSSLQGYGADRQEELAQEFEKTMEADQRIVDEHELLQQDRRVYLMWGVVIAVLMVGIFAVGVINALRHNRESEDGQEEK